MSDAAAPPVYRDLDREALEWEYNARLQVPEHERLAEAMAAASAAYRERAGGRLDLRYGDGPRQRLDLFGGGGGAPVLLWVHGGYWRSRDKSTYSFVAEPFAAAGGLVAVASYDLCPDVAVDDIVREIREACAWLYRNAAAYGGDPALVHVAGNSAGGHLTAMTAVTDWTAFASDLPPDLVKSATPLSGLFDLEPVALHSVNHDLRLDADAVRRLSPVHHRPRAGTPVSIFVGADESAEFRRQSRLLAEAWSGSASKVTCEEVPGRNHFTIVGDMAEPDYPVTRVILAHMGLRAAAGA